MVTPKQFVPPAPGMPYPRSMFEDYIALFSENDTDDYRGYYTEDVLYERGNAHIMHGIEEILAFYREVHDHAHQKLIVANYAATESFIGAEVYSEFRAFKDWSHSSGFSIKRGEVRLNHNFVHYGLRGGLIAHIKSAHFQRLSHELPKE